VTAILVTALVIAIPAVAFTLWPLRRGGRTMLALPPDPRERLLEDKHRILGALRELSFEHDAGHVSDEDYADLQTRYEREAASILGELDRVAVTEVPTRAAAPASAARRPAWRHPVAVGAGALALLLFGVALGAGVVRNTAPDPTAGQPMPGSRPLADVAPSAPGPAMGGPGGAPRVVTPEILQGMLSAARESLFAGRYSEAIAAYQAILKRDPKNVDALTHMGLIVAIGGHADSALETFDKVLAADPNYAPALLYRGQVLDEIKHDVPAAIRSWEKLIAVTPPGEERERVAKMIADARSRGGKPAK
jgi:tetratricopeptide (TPR) repeat protein